MRAVTRAAGASVSAANYHFGSKEELLRAALRRRISSLNQRRIELLEATLADAPGPPRLEDLLDAWVRPAFELQGDAETGGSFYRHVAARLYAEPPEVMASLKSELMAHVLARFSAALQGVLPDVAPERHALLLQLAVGTLVHVLSGQIDSSLVEPGEGLPEDRRERLLQTVVRFTAGGIRAASAEEPS